MINIPSMSVVPAINKSQRDVCMYV
jgi:hypothetical protein